MKRLLTAALLVPLALLAVFRLPSWWFFSLVAVLLEWGVIEYVRLLREKAPAAPLRVLYLAVPLSAVTLALALEGASWLNTTALLLACGVLSIGVGSLVLLSRTPLGQVVPALGIIGFGIPYFALPIASLHALQRENPWLLFLLLAIVWLGDTAAYYVGSAYGRHKLAPVVSPKKSWEGAVAGFVTSVAAAIVWSFGHLGRLDLALICLAAVTAVAGQLGDLVESALKRSVGIKDSGDILPGHGGMFDRMDAMLFAAPVLLAGMRALELVGAAR